MAEDTMSYSVKKHDNGMLAIAESLATREEVLALLQPLAESAFLASKRNASPVYSARWNVILRLNRFCEGHYYAGFQRKKTIDRITKRLLRGYQKYLRRVEREEAKIRKRCQKEGKTSAHARQDAIRAVCPELFEDE